MSLSYAVPGNRTSIRFLAVGDWGGVPYPPYVTAVQKTTAQEMTKVAEQMGADFILALGDNFYYKGVDSVDSPRFQVSWVYLWCKTTPFEKVCFCEIKPVLSFTKRKPLRLCTLQSPSESLGMFWLVIMTMQEMSKPRSSTHKSLTDGKVSLNMLKTLNLYRFNTYSWI